MNEDPVNSVRRRVAIAVALVLAGMAAGAGMTALVLSPPVAERGEAAKAVYQCPMHPTITSSHPGDCPICGMKLVRRDAPAQGAPAAGSTGRRIRYYRSPMDPGRTSPTPRKDEMGMDYVPVYEDAVPADESAVPGRSTVTIDAGRQQLIGLRTAPVSRGPVGGSWRSVGSVEVDPTRVRRVNIKVDGYVERMFVDFVGRPVRRGQPLYSIYSPSVLAAESELLLALRTRDRLRDVGAAEDDGSSLVDAARRRLELWDVPAAEIRRLEKTRTVSREIVFVSPIAGVVTAKNVVQGSRLNPGDTPYEITSLDEVWVMADAYEGDLARVRAGMTARLTLAAFPGRVFTGRVAFVDPLLDSLTRTAKVHVHLPNPGGVLKPAMFGEVVLEGGVHPGLHIPSDAVVRSGRRDVVFVALGGGRFAPREVELGAPDGDRVEVRSGLAEGEQVVTRANFLVDSESNLRAALSAMEGP